MTVGILESQMSEHEARRITERIRIVAVTFAESRQKLIDLVQQAKEGYAHIALGYASWTDYLQDTLGEEPMRLARDERRDMAQVLTAEGMSTRAVGAILGVDNATIHRDLNASVASATVAPREVMGIDGRVRTYAPKPSAASATSPDETPAITQAPNNSKTIAALDRASASLSGLAMALQTLNIKALTSEEAHAAHVNLSEQLKTLNRIHRTLKEKANQ